MKGRKQSSANKAYRRGSASFATFGEIACAAVLLVLVAGCADSPDRLYHLIPENVEISHTLDYNTDWGICAVGVYQLTDRYLRTLRTDGLATLPHLDDQTDQPQRSSSPGARAYGRWHVTPVVPEIYDSSFLSVVVDGGLECFENYPKYRSLIEKYAFRSSGGFWAHTAYDDVALLLPDQGILILIAH